MQRSFYYAISLSLAFFLCFGGVQAQKVPPHIAAMTANLIKDTKDKIDSSENPVLKDTAKILKAERIHHWSKKPVAIKGGIKKLTESIGLDTDKPQNLIAIRQLLQETDISNRYSIMKSVLEKNGQKADENFIMESLANFDMAKEALFKSMATDHRYKISKNEKAVMRWDPQTQKYEMRITSAEDQAGKKKQQAILSGDIELRPSKDGNDLEMHVEPSSMPVKILSYEEIKKREDHFFSEWSDGEDVWTIKPAKKKQDFKRNENLPVDKNNPINISDMADNDAQAVEITVTRGEDGSQYSYRNAYLDGLTIKADRTLTSEKDITELPGSIISQLISSWSPPEWIELEIVHGLTAKDTKIEGDKWRLHVTYENSIAGPGDVTKIANPYCEESLVLTQEKIPAGNTKAAEGAAKNEIP